MGRKRLSLKTKLASALLALGDIPYNDAKGMTEAQLISLYQFDHNMFHESGHPQRDMYWNIIPRLIKAHRDKTRQDAAIIAKGKRIRRKLDDSAQRLAALRRSVLRDLTHGNTAPRRATQRLKSRGFDKRFRRRMDGTVEKR